MTDRYIVLIEVDNRRALALYRQAWDGIETLWPGIVAHCAPLDEEVRARWKQEDEEDRANRNPYAYPRLLGRWYGELRQPRYDLMRSTIKRGLDLASQAISPFKVTEEQALLLADIESGDWIRRIENALAETSRNGY